MNGTRGALLALVLVPALAWPHDGPHDKPHGFGPAARIDGYEAVSLADLYEAAAPAIEAHDVALRSCQIEADRDHAAALESVLRDLVHAELRKLEAERAGVTAAEVATRIDAAADPVTDADVAEFHWQSEIAEPLADVAAAIRAYLEQQAVDRARAVAYRELERRHSVVYVLEPLRYEVAADGFPAYGPPDAAVTIVEFSDFECPYCEMLLPALNEVKAHYPESVRLVYRHYPITSIHPNAWKAAEASLCADEQGAFWELHDLMFAEQGTLTVDALKTKAVRLALDGEAFAQCLDSDRYYDAVNADLSAGVALGVSGTPALFINGRFVNGAVPFEHLAAIIDDELRRADRINASENALQ